MPTIVKTLIFGAIAGAALLAFPTAAHPDDDDWEDAWEDALEEQEEAWEDFYKDRRKHRWHHWNNGRHSPWHTHHGRFGGYGPSWYQSHPHYGYGFGHHGHNWYGRDPRYGGYPPPHAKWYSYPPQQFYFRSR